MSKRSSRSDGLIYSTGPRPIDPEEERSRATKAQPSGPATAVLRFEKKGRGGKAVTVIELRGVDEERASDLGKRLKAACGVGGTVKAATIELQGDQRDRARPLLEKENLRVKG